MDKRNVVRIQGEITDCSFYDGRGQMHSVAHLAINTGSDVFDVRVSGKRAHFVNKIHRPGSDLEWKILGRLTNYEREINGTKYLFMSIVAVTIEPDFGLPEFIDHDDVCEECGK